MPDLVNGGEERSVVWHHVTGGGDAWYYAEKQV